MTHQRDLRNAEILLTWGHNPVVKETLQLALTARVKHSGEPSSDGKLRTYIVSQFPHGLRHGFDKGLNTDELINRLMTDPQILRATVKYLGFLRSRWGHEYIPLELHNTNLTVFPIWEPEYKKHSYTQQDLLNSYKAIKTSQGTFHSKRRNQFWEAANIELKHMKLTDYTPTTVLTASPVVHNICVTYLDYVHQQHGEHTFPWLQHEGSRNQTRYHTQYAIPSPEQLGVVG